MSKSKKQAQKLEHDSNLSQKSHLGTWFRGEHTHFNPKRIEMVPETAVRDKVLKGWLPQEPCITPSTQITAFGSCFAFNISNWLARRNYRVLTKDEESKGAYVVSMGEGMVNSFVIRQQFEWAWENKKFEDALWHGYDAESYGYDPEVQAETKRIFDTTDVFILTFGLSEVWYDEPTGNVFWRTIPREVYDETRHKFRVSTVEENRENIEAIYQLIRKHRPDAKMIFTLSPVPLIATFRDNSCLTSNSVSKAVLRVSIDEVYRAHKDEGVLHYWPSYELVSDVFHLPYVEDRRHTERAVLDYIMTEFEHSWCINADSPPPSLRAAWVRACAAAGLLPKRLQKVVEKRHIGGLENLLANEKAKTAGHPDREEATRALLQALLEEWKAEDAAKDVAAE
ncbi:GSCFA domain-containing protein [Alphaproteobacteria bacterium KMM 3653]|uniref:GSCFA domain-containing protein n=1 Tax=Harenicola maris TaxID=2841044 RepID=A0AAP2CLX9_9RHOB|nr:GSCFA domain-containing protein [Harenicola maris]